MSRRLALLIAPALLAGLIGFVPASADLPFRTPCDLRDKAHCLLPFPNDHFTRPAIPGVDRSGTGKMVDFNLLEMPRSILGKPIDPTELNRQDGFSPGSTVLAFVPGLDLHRTWGTHDDFAGDPRLGGPVDPRDHISDIARYEADDAPILIIDASTGERWPFWSELDMNAQTKEDERVLILRPARNFLEGHRYLVALRNMRRSDGSIIKPSSLFKLVVDAVGIRVTVEVGHAQHIGAVIDEIEAAEAGRGFDRDELYLAWDFTVASEQNLSERVLHIRDTALALLGDATPASGINGSAPSYTITKVTELPDANKQRQVEGTVSVPNFLDRPPYPTPFETIPQAGLPMQAIGGRFLYGPDGLPMQNPAFPTVDVPFSCTIPRVATAENPAHPIVYGHGLLGSRGEANGGSNDRNRERNFMPCAINWMGFAEYDIVNAVHTLADPSNMPAMIDRAQQGFLNWIIFQRAIVHPTGGFATNAAFQSGGQPLMQGGTLAYDGNSQGGIMGGALCALSVDLTRCVLGVPGMNYSTLLNRSVDWEGPLVNESVDPMDPSDDPEDYLPSYSSLLYTMFPNKIEQQVVMALMQMLWDRGEGNGYAQHMTSDPLPNTPAHQVMLHVALGDFQVANVSAEVEARTIGARVLDTSLTATTTNGLPRHWSVDPFFGMTPFDRDGGNLVPWNGSAIVYWDSGNLVPPNANVPPALDGGDPHEDPRRDPRAGDQKAAFWLTGLIQDVMGGGPYLLCRPGQGPNIPRVPSMFASDWCV